MGAPLKQTPVPAIYRRTKPITVPRKELSHGVQKKSYLCSFYDISFFLGLSHIHRRHDRCHFSASKQAYGTVWYGRDTLQHITMGTFHNNNCYLIETLPCITIYQAARSHVRYMISRTLVQDIVQMLQTDPNKTTTN